MSKVTATLKGVPPIPEAGRRLSEVKALLDDGLYPCISGHADIVMMLDHTPHFFKEGELVYRWQQYDCVIYTEAVPGTVNLIFRGDKPKEHPGQSMTHEEWCAAVAQDGQRNAGTCQCDECDS